MAKQKWAQTWTPKLVAQAFEDAAFTMRRIPPVRIPGYISSWPPIIQEFWEAYGWNKSKVRLGPPTGEAIDRMDECLGWLLWLEPEESKLVWARACRVRWQSIARRLGMCRRTAWSRWMAALMQIADALNAQ